MSEKPTVLKIQNVKKRYMIKSLNNKSENNNKKLKSALSNFFNSNKSKEPFYALNGISFDVKQGEKVGIIGKNGAGKSTLLKVISRITEPSDGRIEMLGKISSMLEVGTGFNTELTGRENVYLNGAILGMTKTEVDKKFDDILEFSEVGKFIDTPVKRYSSGMFVRLAFAVAANLESDILLVDEVLAVGDTKFQKKCINKMMDIAASGRTILFVSHQMSIIRELCDRVIVLKEGKIIFDGDVEEGIKIYDNHSIMDIKNHYDFSDYKRPDGCRCEKAEIKYLDLIDNNSGIYKPDKQIKIRIHFSVKEKNLGDFSYRILIWKNDNSPVSTFFSTPFANINEIGEFDSEVIINKHNLAPGIYNAIVVLCGNVSRHYGEEFDIINPAFAFEITNSEGERRRWSRFWGNSEFTDVDINLL